MTNAPPGWQPDPSGRHEQRYWDGTTWTERVADGAVPGTDPIGPSGEQPAVVPGAPGSGEQVPPGGQPWSAPGGAGSSGQFPPSHSGGMPAQPPRTGPSTNVLVGLGIVVVGLVIAIGVLLLTDSGGDDDDVETTSNSEPDDTTATTADTGGPTTTEALEEMNEEELEDELPAGLSTEIDTMVADFQGEIDEDDAMCMLREAAAEGVRRDIDSSQDFNLLPTEDQSAIMFTMLDNCVDAEQLMANLIASGMVESGEVTEAQADCASNAIVETIGAETLIDAIAANQYDPISELSEDNQIAAQDAVFNCL